MPAPEKGTASFGDEKAKRRRARVLIFSLACLLALVLLGLILYRQNIAAVDAAKVTQVAQPAFIKEPGENIDTFDPYRNSPNTSLPSLENENIIDAQYYVSPNGDDANPGTLNQPWKTLSYAAEKLHAGATLFIRGGVYAEHINITANGSQDSPILITNFNGEEVVVDGLENTLPKRDSGTPLIGIYGDWVILSNVTVRYSGTLGVYAKGTHVTLSGLFVHHNWGGGAILSGDYDLIQDSRIWYNSTMNENGQSTDGWGTGVSCARYPDHCTIRTTIVWENWGEGISTFEALHTTIEDNITFDNQQNIYISDTKYTLTQRNISYCTPGNKIDSYETQSGILVGDEKQVPIPLAQNGTRYPSSNNTFLNNIVMGCNRNLAAAEQDNDFFAYNTFVNAGGKSTEEGNVLFYAGTASNVSFLNNIVLQEDARPLAIIGGTDITFMNNLWSRRPPHKAAGQADVIGDPKLAKTGALYTPAWFALTAASPAIGMGLRIQEVATDFYINLRGVPPDIGAIEYEPILQP